MLEINNISKSFGEVGSKQQILSGLSLLVESGQKVAIVGKSGSGKSTLLSLICGTQKTDGGTIVIDGIDITKLDESDITELRAESIANIFQDFKLISHLNVLENIMLPQEIKGLSGIVERSKSMLGHVDLINKDGQFPESLSGGERQRVAIARALASESKIILADEPNANLDIETGKLVMEYLFNIVNEYKKTLLLVTHDEDLARHCDIVYKMNDGVLKRVDA